MEKLRFDDREVVKLALQQEISRSPESRYDHRLHGLLFLCQGMSSYEVGNLLGHSLEPSSIGSIGRKKA